MAESGQQQHQGEQQQGEQQQQENPLRRMARALSDIRRVQNLLELTYPDQTDAIKMQRQAGDLIWAEIERMRQESQQASQ